MYHKASKSKNSQYYIYLSLLDVSYIQTEPIIISDLLIHESLLILRDRSDPAVIYPFSSFLILSTWDLISGPLSRRKCKARLFFPLLLSLGLNYCLSPN